MSPGQSQSKTIKVSSDRAFGPYPEDLAAKVGSGSIDPELGPKVGQTVDVSQRNGHTIVATIPVVMESGVTVDANHPLAGQDLTFDLELVEIA